MKYTTIELRHWENGKPVGNVEPVNDYVTVYYPVINGVPYMAWAESSLKGLHASLEAARKDDEVMAEYLKDLPAYPTLSRHLRNNVHKDYGGLQIHKESINILNLVK